MSLPPFGPPLPPGDSQIPPSDLLIDRFRSKHSWNARLSAGLNDPGGSFARRSRDLKVAFAEIDGLMAGINYMDKRYGESSSRSDDLGVQVEDALPTPRDPSNPPAPNVEDSCYPDILMDEEPVTEARQAPRSNIPKRPPSSLHPFMANLATQWTALRKLRIETERHHQRFLQITEATDDPVLARLRTTYPTSKKVRKQGMLLMRQILDDYQPNKVEEIFAFTSLSYAIAKRLHAQGKIDHASILADFQICCDAISDDANRASFLALASVLWPESVHHVSGAKSQQNPDGTFVEDLPDKHGDAQSGSYLPNGSHNQYPPADYRAERAYATQVNTDIFQPEPGGVELGLARLASFDMQSSHEFWNFAAATPTMWNSLPLDDNHPSTIPPSFREMDLGLCDEFRPFINDLPSSEQWEPSVAQGVAPGNSDAAFQPQNPPSADVELRLSKMVLVVLQFCREVKSLVDILSGHSFTSKHESTKMYETQRQSIEKFYEAANRSFFEPLRTANKPVHRHFAALLAVTRTLTRLGYFKSLAEIRHYMWSVGLNALFPPGEAQERFMNWVAGHGNSRHNDSGYRARNPPRGRKRKASPDQDVADGQHPAKQSRGNMTKCSFRACRAFFETEDDLNKHEKMVHNKGKELSCRFGFCDYKTTRKDRMQKHQMDKHPDVSTL